MFIRLKQNKSGSTSVILVTGERVPGKKHVVSRIIKNFGSRVDKEEIAALRAQAEEHKARLLLSVGKPRILKITEAWDIRSCNSYNIGFDDIYGRLLFDTLSRCNLLDLKQLKSLKELVTLRIAEPCSKLMSSVIASKYSYDLKVHNIYRFMDKMDSKTITQIKQTIYQTSQALLKEAGSTVDIMFYDLTTISFETNNSDDLRDFGFSKDGKHQHVQIVLAVMVTNDGLPISYEYFPGNCYEGHTLIPALDKLKSEYNIERIVVVADSALMTKVNIEELNNLGFEYIISAKLKGGGVAQNIKNFCLDKTTEQLLTQKSDKTGEVIDILHSKEIDLNPCDKLVVFHSSKRQKKDEHDRLKDLEKIDKHLDCTSIKASLTYTLKKSYISTSSKNKIFIDEKKLEESRKFDGYFGLRTNIKDIDHLKLLASYRGLWQIEESFRIAKHNLKIRPVYHFSKKRIAAHIAICYISLAMIRYLEFKLKTKTNLRMTIEQLHLTLSSIRRVDITDHEGNIFAILEDPPKEAALIYQALDLKFPKKFIAK